MTDLSKISVLWFLLTLGLTPAQSNARELADNDDTHAEIFKVNLSYNEVTDYLTKSNSFSKKEEASPITKKTLSLLNEIRSKQKNSKGLIVNAYNSYYKTSKDTEFHYRMVYGAEYSQATKSADPAAVAFQTEAEQIIQNHIQDNYLKFKALEKGLDFSFDLTTLFSSNSNKSASARPKTKYGLVVKDVSLTKGNNFASTLPPEEEFRAADQVPGYQLYTIGLIEKNASDEKLVSNSGAYKEKAKPFSLYNLLKHGVAPSTRIKSKIAPESLAVKEGQPNGNLTLTMTQTESIYSMKRSQAIGQTTAVNSYQTRLPLYNSIAVSQDLNDDMTTTHSHLEAVVGSVHSKLTLTEESKALSATATYRASHTDIKFTFALPEKWAPNKGLGKSEAELYSLNLTRHL